MRELAALFLKLGATAFGGPAAHIAMMEDEVVRRRGWLTAEEFLDLVGATNLIPGPNSTELAIHIGLRRGGWPGLLVAGGCFILPAAGIVTAIAWAYTRYGTLPQAAGALSGVRPVIVAVVAQALWSLGRTALAKRHAWALAVAAVALLAAGVHELAVLAILGATGAARAGAGRAAFFVLAPAAATKAAVGLGPLFLFFLKVGAMLFGSGYVLVAFLRADLVDRWGWLTNAQLLDAVAVGQFTPGPVFTTATFIGFVLAGPMGAAAATVGIFLPAFVFVALSAPWIPRLRASRWAGGFLDGVNVASLAMLALVAVQLGQVALVDGWTVAIAALALVALLRFKLNSAWLVLAGLAAGLVHG